MIENNIGEVLVYKQILIFILLISIPAVSIFIIISRTMKERNNKMIESLNNPETREQTLNNTTADSGKMYSRLKYFLYTQIVVSIVFMLIGAIAFVGFFHKVFTSNFSTIFKEYNGIQFYFITPFALIYGIFLFLKGIRNLKEYKQKK